MTSPTPEERAKRADGVLHSYLPLDDRNSHALIEVLCDLMHWADTDDLDFTTKVNEAQDLYETERRSIVPVPTPTTNGTRRARAATAIDAYCQSVGDIAHDEALNDLLTDLMHWSRGNGLDFQQAHNHAQLHFDAEVAS